MRIRIEPAAFEFEATADQTILQAAEQAGITLPSSCRNGTCRSCICLRTSGQTRHLIEWPGLSIDEKLEGWILPCCAVASTAVTLWQPTARRT